MICGDCPYDDCDGPLMVPLADQCPAYQRHECETCRRIIWTRHSRLDPWSMTEADFLATHEIIEATKQIRPRSPGAPDTERPDQ